MHIHFKPCPFCGSHLIEIGWELAEEKGVMKAYYTAGCAECPALVRIQLSTSENDGLPNVQHGLDMAMKAWNRRT